MIFKQTRDWFELVKKFRVSLQWKFFLCIVLIILPTLGVIFTWAGIQNKSQSDDQVVNQARILTRQIVLTRQWVTDRGYDDQIEATIKSVAMMLEADIRMMVGGDYGISIAPHGTYARDLEMFVTMFGMTPGKALLCATRDGGAAADPEGRVGTLEAGKFADIVIVNGDPIADISIVADHSKLTAKFVRTPALGDVPYPVMMEPNLVVEFYAKN